MPPTNFWDFKKSQSRRKSPAEGKVAAGPRPAPGAMTVSQMTELIDDALKTGLPASVAVRGEVSNFKLHNTSGHMYFTLKDPGACIDCVMFRSDAVRLKFQASDGMELVAHGRVGVYAQRGRYQLYVTSMTPVGQGALELARRQIEAKLRAEGLFDLQRKKPLPWYPRTIALVTSGNTAAIQDMLKVLRDFGFLRVVVYDVPVQGDGAAEKIAAAIAHLNAAHRSIGGVDVILLARGGGSLEDLWEFNEEILVRAVAASEIPIVSGIGHEIDVSIADLAADYHAHTPTEAAQVVVRRWRSVPDLLATAAARFRRELRAVAQDARHRLSTIERHEMFRRPLDRINQLRQLIDDLQQDIGQAVGDRISAAGQNLARLESRLRERHPRHLVQLHIQKTQSVAQRLAAAMKQLLAKRTLELDGMAARLQGVNPSEVLKRGYSITTAKKGGQIIRDPSQVKPGDTLITRLSAGQIESVVEDSRQLKLFE